LGDDSEISVSFVAFCENSSACERLNAATITVEQATGFGLFMLKAVISGRGDELVDVAKVNLFR
jgi:hypothetical protein